MCDTQLPEANRVSEICMPLHISRIGQIGNQGEMTAKFIPAYFLRLEGRPLRTMNMDRSMEP